MSDKQDMSGPEQKARFVRESKAEKESSADVGGFVEFVQGVTQLPGEFGQPAIAPGKGRLGSCRPSLWLIGSSVIDLLIGSTLAICGIAMAPLPI